MNYWLIVAFVTFVATSPFFLWVYYLAVMNLKRVNKESKLEGMNLHLGKAALIIGYLLDAFVNFTVMTIVLLEFPRELTVTSRLKRHYKLEGSWRRKVVVWFLPLLEPFDPGHITNI